jgi:hypothetical protein
LKAGEGVQGGKGITTDEREILGMFEWNKNEAVLHADPAVGLIDFQPLSFQVLMKFAAVDAKKPSGVVLLELSHQVHHRRRWHEKS